MTLPAGTTVGSYEVVAFLASGGFGDVYHARHRRLGHDAALKVLHAALAVTRDGPRRFEREALTASRVRHANVVEIWEVGLLADGRPYLVMEKLGGVDLGEHVRRAGRLSLGETVTIAEQLAAALGAAHALGVIHRDLKASNVFLEDWSGRRRVVLLDFGIAKLLDPDAEDLTGSRKVVGTPVCMAPEQIKGAAVDARTDVYALGALVHHMLTGRPPFDDESATVTQYLHLTAGRPRASEAANVSRAVDAVLERAMAIAPEERHPSAADLVADLRRAIIERPRAEERTADALAAYVEGPGAEALLAEAGMTIVVRTPDAATGVIVAGDGAGVLASLAAATRDQLVLVHRGRVTLRGEEVTGGELLRLARWGRPPRARGVFVTRAAHPSPPDDATDFIRWGA